MDGLFINLMEALVESKLDEIIDTLDCCKCERCRRDIIAYALNHLPSKYVTSESGMLFAKLEFFSLQHEANVMTQLLRAVEIVSRSPRHEENMKKSERERITF
ncbi:MAG: late competence development ComFB family protein [Clostridia bacterium]|nr:late competence development ComFB family protein [Clostridia bacterium]